jgi:hypothetical protein
MSNEEFRIRTAQTRAASMPGERRELQAQDGVVKQVVGDLIRADEGTDEDIRQ